MVPAVKPLSVVVVPVPVVVVDPGLVVKVHVPTAGNPDKAILPVATAHVTCVMVPMIGAVGVVVPAFKTAFVDVVDEHVPSDTLKEYVVPAVKPLSVVVVPVPVVVVDPGLVVKVHVPTGGNPDKSILPVANTHVACVMVPMIGADGGVGCTFKTAFAEATDVQVPLETVNE